MINCEVGNTYGSLCIKEENGKFYWSVEDWNGHDWQEISEATYNAIKNEIDTDSIKKHETAHNSMV